MFYSKQNKVSVIEISKIIFLLSALVLCDFGYSQTKMPSMDSITPNYDRSFSSADTILFTVGERTAVQQMCTDKISRNLTDHTLGFQELYIKDNAYRAVFYFEDTILVKAIYFYKGKDKTGVFELFGLDKNDFSRMNWFTHHYRKVDGNTLVNSWFDRKSFFYQEEVIKTE